MGALVVSSEFISYEDFLRAYDGVHAEWVDGKAVPMTPVSPRHQMVANFLATLFQHWCDAHDAGTVLSAPVQMRIGEAAREPDVMVVLRDHEDRITASRVEGPADLVVEVISPESRARDRGEKFYEYEQAGVREYWLVDPARCQVEQYVRGDRGLFEIVTDPPSRLESRVLRGAWIDTEWLWSERLPKLNAVLKEWGLI